MNLAPIILDRFKSEEIPAEVPIIAGTPPVLNPLGTKAIKRSSQE